MSEKNELSLTWKKLLTPQRFNKLDKFTSYRSPFSKDADRILFSEPFRRLGKKSQVHPLAINDNLHNRLIHSLEVSSAGKSLGFMVGNFLLKTGEFANLEFRTDDGEIISKEIYPLYISEIVYAACLAHDLGNPPFGHAGEEAIRAWFLENKNSKYLEGLDSRQQSDFTGFDGNAQSFRIINSHEIYSASEGGMCLTYPTIGAMIKYPWSSYKAAAKRNANIKYSHHDAEFEKFIEIFKTLGLSSSKKKHCRHPLSYLSEAADDICYSIMDLEDAFELKIISFEDIVSIYEKIPGINNVISSKQTTVNKVKNIRAIVVNHFIHLVAQLFQEKYKGIMKGEFYGNLIDELSCKHSQIKEAKNFAREKIFNEKRKISLEIGAYNIYQSLLDAFIPACFEVFMQKNSHKYKHQKARELLESSFEVKIRSKNMSLYDAYMLVIDYITGSTDLYATFLGKQFAGAGIDPWQ